MFVPSDSLSPALCPVLSCRLHYFTGRKKLLSV